VFHPFAASASAYPSSASVPSSNAASVMNACSAGPVMPALVERLSNAVLAFLGPRHPVPDDEPPHGQVARYATFDAPTYQRRGLRIPGLEAVSSPGSPPRSALPTPSARRSAR
jgi:hypothetical protein